MKGRFTTALRFFAPATIYVPGKGTTKVWAEIAREGGAVFFGSWKNAYGEAAIGAFTAGVSEAATVRIGFHPALYAAMRGGEVLVAKDGDGSVLKDGQPDRTNPNAWTVWGGADNVDEGRRMIEFRVRRYEGK